MSSKVFRFFLKVGYETKTDVATGALMKVNLYAEILTGKDPVDGGNYIRADATADLKKAASFITKEDAENMDKFVQRFFLASSDVEKILI